MEHQPPVILIPSSEDEGGAAQKRERDAGCWRSVDEEYKILADLTGFDNLRAILETERVHMRSKKRKRKRKTKKKKIVAYGAQEEVTAVDVREEELADEVFAPKSNLVSDNIDASHNIAADAEREKEQVDGVKAVEKTEAFKGNGVVKSSAVIDLCSSSTEEDRVEVNIWCCRAAKELVPADTVVLKRRKKKTGKMSEAHDAANLLIPLLKSHLKISSLSRKRKNRSGGTVMSFRTDPVGSVSREKKDKSGGTVMSFRKDPVGSVSREKKDKSRGTVMSFRKDPAGIVLRKLLRGPRYFDPPSSSTDECFKCGGIHLTKKCSTTKRKKPCGICAGYGHNWKRCPQCLDCFSCKGRGHMANHCPEKNQRNQPRYDICLRCGESGHDLLSCRSNYSHDDLKKIQCYVCKKFGHLCCVNFKDLGPGCVSCYNCGQSGHLGSDCIETRGSARVATSSKRKEDLGHSTFMVATCSEGKEEEGHSVSMVTTSSKRKEENHSAGRWADSLLNTNAFTIAHIESVCSTTITPTLRPEQKLGASLTVARGAEICKESNFMPQNVDETQRKNQCEKGPTILIID